MGNRAGSKGRWVQALCAHGQFGRQRMNILVVFTIAVFGVMGVGVLAGYLLDRYS